MVDEDVPTTLADLLIAFSEYRSRVGYRPDAVTAPAKMIERWFGGLPGPTAIAGVRLVEGDRFALFSDERPAVETVPAEDEVVSLDPPEEATQSDPLTRDELVERVKVFSEYHNRDPDYMEVPYGTYLQWVPWSEGLFTNEAYPTYLFGARFSIGPVFKFGLDPSVVETEAAEPPVEATDADKIVSLLDTCKRLQQQVADSTHQTPVVAMGMGPFRRLGKEESLLGRSYVDVVGGDIPGVEVVSLLHTAYKKAVSVLSDSTRSVLYTVGGIEAVNVHAYRLAYHQLGYHRWWWVLYRFLTPWQTFPPDPSKMFT